MPDDMNESQKTSEEVYVHSVFFWLEGVAATVLNFGAIPGKPPPPLPLCR